jgi:hypothetical protein
MPSKILQPRRAEWIWRQRPEGSRSLLSAVFSKARPFKEEQNRFVYFRKTFQLLQSPEQATLKISADGRYQLFVNGQFVGRGPARCDPAWQTYDSYDLQTYLQPGKNLIAVLGHSYGQNMSWYELPRHEASRILGCGGIFVQADISAGDEQIQVDSDESWRYLESDAWLRQTPAAGTGFTEIYDARREAMGWQLPDFDDSNWQTAQVLNFETSDAKLPPFRPFPVMVERDIPLPGESLEKAQQIYRYGEVLEVPEAPNLARRIGAEKLIELELCRVENVEALLEEGNGVTVQTVPGRAVTIVLDFGQTVTGRPRLDFSAPEGAVIDVGFSERLQDDHIEPQEPGFAAQNVDRVIAREGRQQWERFEWTGLRYLQLTIRHATQPLTIHAVELNFTSYPVEYQGSFESSDPLLNQIWEAGAYTVQLCMQDGYIDCPLREQRQWVGDAYVESLINFVAFGDPYLTARLLRQVAQTQRPDGMTQMATLGDMAADGTMTITDYCLYWLMTIREYVRYTGDQAIVTELFPSVEKALAWFERHLNQHGLLENLPHWLFVDWAQVDKRGESAVLNAQYYHSLLMCAELAEMVDAGRQAENWRAQAELINQAINTYLWDEARGVYVDCRVRGEQSRRVSQHANAMCIGYGVAPRSRWNSILAYITDPTRLKLTALGMGSENEIKELPPFDEEQDVVLAQPFFMHHIHRALIQAGRTDLLLANIRQHWGAMLANGGTSLWETWQPHLSQCHGWSGTPTYNLSTVVLGIAPLTNGFEYTLIAPQPADLQWARGSCPTPHGNIFIGWQLVEEGFRLEVTAPEKVLLEIILPVGASSVEVNGQLVWLNGMFVRNNSGVVEGQQVAANSLWFSCLPCVDGTVYKFLAKTA